MNLGVFFDIEQINEQASDEVLEIEQKYNEVRRPVYTKRNDIIKCIPDFWLTAVSDLFTLLNFCFEFTIGYKFLTFT